MKKSVPLIALAILASFFVSAANAQVNDHLECYKIKDPIKLNAVVDLDALQNRFDVATAGLKGCVLSTKAALFCVPVTKSVRPSVPPTSATGFVGPAAADGPALLQAEVSQAHRHERPGGRSVCQTPDRRLRTGPALRAGHQDRRNADLRELGVPAMWRAVHDGSHPDLQAEERRHTRLRMLAESPAVPEQRSGMRRTLPQCRANVRYERGRLLLLGRRSLRADIGSAMRRRLH